MGRGWQNQKRLNRKLKKRRTKKVIKESAKNKKK
jgi:hypothetical protein